MSEFNNIIYMCLKELGCDFSEFLHSKHERIKLQKYSYLIEKVFGLGIGRYSLYLNGPYNSVLADELFAIARNETDYQVEILGKNIGQEAKQILSSLKGLFIDNSIEEVDLLELYTTFDFLRKYYPSYSEKEIFDKLYAEKGHILNKYSSLNIYELLKSIDVSINGLISA